VILDMHAHSKKSEDSRATVVGYLQWLLKKKDILPIDGLVLTEHRQFDSETDYRHLEDEYGIRIFKGSEVETDYGHVLVYGVNASMLERFDFTNVVRTPVDTVKIGMPVEVVFEDVDEGLAIPKFQGIQ